MILKSLFLGADAAENSNLRNQQQNRIEVISDALIGVLKVDNILDYLLQLMPSWDVGNIFRNSANKYNKTRTQPDGSLLSGI
jgi:hypothetical protein